MIFESHYSQVKHRSKSSMQTINVGVIGYGYWGPNQVRNFNELDTVNLVAVADQNETQLERVKKRYAHVETVTDYHDLFAMGLDAVAVVTPPATHHAIAMDCLRNGLHVLIEKPITLSSADALDLIRTAEEVGKILMVGHTMEYNPAIREMKAMIDRGVLGDIHYINTVRVNLGLFQSKANAIWDLAPHDISILLYLLGAEPVSANVDGVSCVTDGHVDLAYISLRFPNNIHGHIEVSWLSPRKIRQVTVVGKDRMLFHDDVEPVEKIKVFDKGVDGPPPYTETLEQFHWSYRHGDVTIPYLKWYEPLRRQCEEFVDCIVTGRTPQTDGFNGLRVVNVLEAIDKSLQNGGAEQPVEALTLTHSNGRYINGHSS
ncbi:MAG: gfo/Idh/MocA family oxidoreductase [Phototrophicales bacterium]|nr:MAG: gfo/Idh/MocA family oxidoreductase [Phototrophicales bacterium]